MAKVAPKDRRASWCRTIAICLLLSSGGSGALASDRVSRFLELEQEISVSKLGVKLDIAATADGEVYLSGESRGGLWQLAEQSWAWRPLIFPKEAPDAPRHPESIDTDFSGDLWVSDADRHRVVIISPTDGVMRVLDDGGRILRKPSVLSVADADHMGVWTADDRVLVVMTKDSPSLTALSSVPKADYCILYDLTSTYCVQADRRTLSRYTTGRSTRTWQLDGPYARIGDLEAAPDGRLYITDTAGRRIFAVAADLGSAKRFRLYESLFQTPTRLTVTEDRLWLVDEGRKTVMQFRLRTAETPFEHNLLGEEYLALSLHEAALQELTLAHDLGLKGADLDLNIGIALYGLGRYQDALATWTKLAGEPETQGLLRLWQGNALFRLEQYEAAVKAYEAVPEESPDGSRAIFNLGQTYLALDQYAQAKRVFQHLLRRNPDHPFAAVGLARSHMGLGEAEQAAPLLVAAAAEGAAADVARYYLGHLRLTMGDSEAALPLLERAATQGPYFRAALNDLADLNRRLGNAERARFYQQRLQSLPQDADSLAAFILEDKP